MSQSRGIFINKSSMQLFCFYCIFYLLALKHTGNIRSGSLDIADQFDSGFFIFLSIPFIAHIRYDSDQIFPVMIDNVYCLFIVGC